MTRMRLSICAWFFFLDFFLSHIVWALRLHLTHVHAWAYVKFFPWCRCCSAWMHAWCTCSFRSDREIEFVPILWMICYPFHRFTRFWRIGLSGFKATRIVQNGPEWSLWMQRTRFARIGQNLLHWSLTGYACIMYRYILWRTTNRNLEEQRKLFRTGLAKNAFRKRYLYVSALYKTL